MIWVHGFHRVWKCFRDCAYELVFCIVAGGAPRVHSKFPPKNKKTDPIWIGYIDFIRCWRLFRECAYEIVFVGIFGGWTHRVLSKCPPKSLTKNQIWVGHMDFIGCWIWFQDFAYDCFFFAFLVHGFHRLLETVSGFCLRNCFLLYSLNNVHVKGSSIIFLKHGWVRCLAQSR